ncbi:MAG: hypothetical protein IJP35_03495 [Clostridia bacterium]|nr:hypothetical protein [Clostridia bacterium]
MFESFTDVIHLESMTDILPAAGYGWLGVFIVTGVLVAAVYLLGMFGSKGDK